MGIKIGIDAGSTSTKLAALKDNKILDLLKVKSVPTDGDIYDIFNSFMEKNEIKSSDIESIQLTGVGASGFDSKIMNINTKYIHEFDADSNGASYFAPNLDDFLLISMGTGTTYIHVKDQIPTHVGGLGLGGGTLVGLSKYILGTVYYNEIYKLAEGGTHGNVNIMLSDVATNRIEGLDMDLTVSNFGKIYSEASKSDLASGLINLVLENIIQTGCLMANNMGVSNIVMIGGLSGAKELAPTLDAFRKLYPNTNFVSTDNGKYITAIGAALS